MTDAQLIRRAQNGDVDAFNTIVWRWQKRVYNFSLRYIGDPEEAKDICQKTFLKAYQKVAGLQDRSKFSTWLYQIALNHCRDELKKRRRRTMVSLDSLQENDNGTHGERVTLARGDAEQAAKHACNHNLREIIKRALQEIPPQQREVIIMKQYEELKFHEIAEILDTSVNTAKSRMYYGLSALRNVFKQWNITEELLNYEV